MKTVDFNKGWNFTLENSLDAFNTYGLDKYSDAAGAAARFYDHSRWERVDLPHDWAPRLGKDPRANPFAGAYPNTPFHRFMEERRSEVRDIYSVGWYRKEFRMDPEWEGKRVFIEFEGIFRDAVIWVNGVYLERHASGYTSFAVELTDHLVMGEDNSVAVRVDSTQPEGWWYEGAGIYRNVHLLIGEPIYFQYRKTFVRAQTDGQTEASAVLVNDTPETVQNTVFWCVLDQDGREAAAGSTEVSVPPYSETNVRAEMSIEAPHLWSLESPYLYRLQVRYGQEQTEETFGIRSVAFDADRGFFLNGKPVKLRGACVHQDFGGVGTALTDNLQAYKIRRLKEMGVNAYRCSHHAPAPALLKACDELGMLVMDETRMFGTSPEAVRQLTDLVERDRNHPCVFIWSLGNEEFSVQNDAWSRRLMEKMTRIAKGLDPTRPVTYGGNNGPDFNGVNAAAEVRGVNYIRNGQPYWLDQYHRDHPRQPILGTEESSYVASRGGAVNDLAAGLLDTTGQVTMSWGSTPKGWVKFTEERPWFAGSFMWTGFDYRGEPNPFYYTNNASSFGAIDLTGMEEPPFYYYRSWWTDKPVLKLAPHWNHKAGDTVTVAVFTNCEEVSLFLNGRLLETRTVERFDAPLFRVSFEPGVLEAMGRCRGMTWRDALVTAGEAQDVRCEPVLEAEDEADTGIYEICAVDADGRFCPQAADVVEITVQNGTVIGVGNGDPSSPAYEQKPPEEEIRAIPCLMDGDKVWPIPPKKENGLPPRQDWIELEPKQDGYEDDFRLVVVSRTAPPMDRTRELTATISDAEGFEYVEFERLGGQAVVYLNGERIGDTLRWHGRLCRNSVRPYRFYAPFQSGENMLRVVFTYGESDLPLISGYVRIGRHTDTPYHVKLHYGKARVFTRSSTPAELSVSAHLAEKTHK